MHSGLLGRLGEDFAAVLLGDSGMRVLARNYTSRYGEIDLVASDGVTICFVEVKTRRANSMVAGAEAVTPEKRRKIITTALCYLQEFPCDLQPRFDVLSVVADKKGEIVQYEYFTGAFDSDGYYR